MIRGFITNDPKFFIIAFDGRGSVGFMENFERDGYWGGYIETTAFAFLYAVKLVVPEGAFKIVKCVRRRVS